MKRYLTTFAGFALVVAGTMANAANRYVRAEATGNGSGSDWTNAYTALPATLVRGDTYYLADGTYGPYIFDDAESGSTVIRIKKATVSDHGTDLGWSSSYGDGEALFSSGTSSLFRFRSGYYDIDGVRGLGKSPGQYGIRLYSSASRCSGPDMVLFEGSRSINQVALRHIEYDYNNGTSTCSTNVTALIFSPAPTDSITIEKSYFHHSSGFVFYIGPYDPNYGGALESRYQIRDNYFYMNGGGGGESAHWETMWLMNLDKSVIANNIIEDTVGSSGQTGWVMIGKTDNLKIHGNLFFCTSPDCIIGGNGVIATWSHDWCQNSSIHIYNNTFANLKAVFTPQILFRHNSVDDRDIRVFNNLYFNGKFAWGGIDQQSHEACGGGQSCAGTQQQTGLLSSQFLNYSGQDFRLARATTAGDAFLGAPYETDLYGRARGSDGLLDRGAYEYGGTSPSPSPSPAPAPMPAPAPAPAPAPVPAPAPAPAPSPVSGISLLSSLAPTSLNNSDGSSVNYELGMRFMASKAGTIQAIRFFKASSESGTHTGKIYSASGTVLASVVFSSESGSGWQVQRLSSPLRINANTEYVVSVNTGNSYYVASNNGFASQIKNGSLMSATGSAGVYGPVGRKPSSSWQNSNYFRDVVFLEDVAVAPAPVATEVTVDNLAAGSQNAQVSFTGQWCTSTVAGSFGTTSLYSCGASTNTYTYKANLTASGQYDVYVRHSARASRSASVAISVSTASGQVVKNINQQINGTTWVLHGRYSLNMGTATISLSHVNGGGDASVDGVRIVPVPAP